MAKAKQKGPGKRGWAVLAVAAVGGVIGGLALARGGGRGVVPSFVAPPAASDLLGDTASASRTPPRRAPADAPLGGHAEDTPPPIAALAGLPAYPGATPRGLGNDVVAAGMPMAIAYFTTSDPASDVMAFYRNALEASHAHVVHEWATKTTGYVGWRDDKTHELHGVVIRRDAGQTMVFPSVVAPGRLHLRSQQVPDVLPQPPAAERTVVVSMAGAPGTRESSVVSSVPMVTVRSLASFYRKGFIAKAWHVEQVLVNSGDFGRVTATRDDMRAEVYLRHVTGGRHGPHVEIYVILTTRDHA